MYSLFPLLGILILLALGTSSQRQLPTLYEYFATPDGQNVTGLVADEDGFKLNGKPIRIASGAMHYFRIHHQHWRDRLRKLRATGANTVETYVPWNLHEPQKDVWDFGLGGNDNSIFLDVRRFVEIAQEEDLLLIFRPGPYICSEFEFGGMPSYLLRDPDMKVRTAYQPYLDRVKIYLDNLLPIVADLQFTRGGPIIALQLENEYGSFDEIDLEYLEFLQETYLSNGMDSLHFTSDGAWHGIKGTLPGVLKTVNFASDPETNLNDLLTFQPDKPVMVMEFWCGWFDHWFEDHSTTSVDDVAAVLEVILGPLFNGSVNFYMFHGGTNFGFNAGANHVPDNTCPDCVYKPDVTSYDYDAPLSESGDYTAKYYRILEALTRYQIPELRRPLLPTPSAKFAYPPIRVESYLTFSDILDQVPASHKFEVENRMPMENLPINSDSGQSQGYVLYRKMASGFSANARFMAGPVRDFGMLLLDSEIQPFPRHENGSVQYWLNSVQEYNLSLSSDPDVEHTFDLLIENLGRVNFGYQWSFLEQHKGLLGNLSVGVGPEYYHLNGEEIKDIEIFALEFKSAWVQNLTRWRFNDGSTPLKGPILVQSTFIIGQAPVDTFLDMSGWGKGIVFVNGFNLGRYWSVGPQQTLYVPGPFLKVGENTVMIFEQFHAHEEIAFSAVPNLGPTVSHVQVGHGKVVRN